MRLLRVLLATLVVALGGVVAAPGASACACGAAPMPGTSQARVTGESGFVVWDGTTERIDLLMSLSGTTPEAGWVMPAPAGTALSLGDSQALDRLRTATQPVPVKRLDWTPFFVFGGSAAPSAGARSTASVESVKDVGPFRVTTLTGTQASAVNDWLRENGYAARDELVPTFQGYLDQGWRIQAVKLVPGEGKKYSDSLPALRLTFPTADPVYPIRLSHHAAVSQNVQVYVAAPHRMDIRTQAAPGNPMKLRYAGTLPPETTGLDRPVFVTAYEARLVPEQITDDLAFRQATRDDAYVATYTVYDRTPGVILGLVIAAVVVLGPPIALVTGLVVLVVSLVRRGSRRQPPRR